MRKEQITDQMIDDVLEAFKGMGPIFSTLADENRQLIIMALGKHDELNVKELDEIVPLSRPAISHHLKLLKYAGIVNNKKKGTENYYHLTIKSAIENVRTLCDLIEGSCKLL